MLIIKKPERAFKNGHLIANNKYMGLIQYIKDTKGEMKHVSWPTRKQALNYTGLVILISIAVSIYLGFFDWLFTYLMEVIVIKS